MPRITAVEHGTFRGAIVVDTREQLPFTFEGLTCDKADGGGPLMVPTLRAGLPTGDYSLAGYEEQVAVERKGISDLFGTLGQGRDRFERELARLAAMQFAAVVVEATLPEILASPPPFSELNPKTIVRSVMAWQQRFTRVHWWFAGPRRLAEAVTFRVLERFLKERLAEAQTHTEEASK